MDTRLLLVGYALNVISAVWVYYDAKRLNVRRLSRDELQIIQNKTTTFNPSEWTVIALAAHWALGPFGSIGIIPYLLQRKKLKMLFTTIKNDKTSPFLMFLYTAIAFVVACSLQYLNIQKAGF